jgi:hypothetical protein
MTSNYTAPRVDRHWAESRETHIAVATAIHAISDSKRSPEEIWADPTQAEWENVTMAVAEYITNGYFLASDDGQYPWGEETLVVVQ